MSFRYACFIFKATILLLQCHLLSSTNQVKKALIIGGGPSGMVTSLMLQRKGWQTTIFEKRSEFSYEDEARSYLYIIDGRGRLITDYLNVSYDISKYSITNKEFSSISMFLPDGSRKPVKLPPLLKSDIDKFWIPRSKLVNILQSTIYKNNGIAINSIFGDELYKYPIEMVFDADCKNIDFGINNKNNNLMVNMTIIDQRNGQSNIFQENELSLVIACDGINSVVRNKLINMTTNNNGNSVLPKNVNFHLTKYDSPSAGLNYKMMPISNIEPLNLLPQNGMSIRSVGKTKKTFLNLGLFPTKEGLSRSFNFICRPDHELWKIKNEAALSKYLDVSFPQLQPIDRFLPKNALSSFLNRSVGVFPKPQHVNTMATAVGGTEEYSSSGVVLLGDAAHVFPPDIGQGVNSALEDVYCLKECLDDVNNKRQTSNNDEGNIRKRNNLLPALHQFNNRRLKDIKALCKINTFAYPYQYNQDPFMKRLSFINFGMRIGINKILPFLISKPAFLLIGDHKLSYSQILRKVTGSSFVIDFTILGLLFRLIYHDYFSSMRNKMFLVMLNSCISLFYFIRYSTIFKTITGR